METVLLYIVTWGAWLGAGFLLGMLIARRLRPLRFRKGWIEIGRAARAEGHPRFKATAKWIQRYYDKGYDEVQK